MKNPQRRPFPTKFEVVDMIVNGDLTVEGETTRVDEILTDRIEVEDDTGTVQFDIHGDSSPPALDLKGNNLQDAGVIAADTIKNVASDTELALGSGAGNGQVNEVAVGSDAARDNTGNNTTAIGRSSALNNTGDRTTVVGFRAARGDGLSDPTTMGSDNIGIGTDAIRNNQASGLIALGQEAGINAQTDDQLIVTQRDGTRRLEMDLTTGDLSVTGGGSFGGDVSIDGDLDVQGSSVGTGSFNFETGAFELGTGESNSEVNRIVLQSGEQLKVERLELRLVGGGSNADVSARVRDTTAGTTLASQTAGGTTKDADTSGTANTVTVEVSNSSGSVQNVILRVNGDIEGA
jgi:hypothetical protein